MADSCEWENNQTVMTVVAKQDSLFPPTDESRDVHHKLTVVYIAVERMERYSTCGCDQSATEVRVLCNSVQINRHITV